MNGLEPWDQSDRQKQTKVEDKIFWKGRFWTQNEKVKIWWKVIAVCSKLDRHIQMKVAERGRIIRMRNSEWCIGSWFQRRGEACQKEWSLTFEWWWWCHVIATFSTAHLHLTAWFLLVKKNIQSEKTVKTEVFGCEVSSLCAICFCLPTTLHCPQVPEWVSEWVEFNAPTDTIWVISEAGRSPRKEPPRFLTEGRMSITKSGLVFWCCLSFYII